MKTKLNVLTISFVLAALFSSCSTGKVANLNADLFKQTYKSKGVIRKIDPAKGTVTIDHEDIPGYMTAMEMTNPVADPALLSAVKVGDKVDFEILRDGSDVTFTKFAKIGESAVIDAPTIYAKNCAECHGANGEGQKKGIPFTSGHALDHSEADFIKSVTNGKNPDREKHMPAFRDKLKPEEITAVVKFIREDIQKGIEKPKGHAHSH